MCVLAPIMYVQYTYVETYSTYKCTVPAYVHLHICILIYVICLCFYFRLWLIHSTYSIVHRECNVTSTEIIKSFKKSIL